MTKQTGGWPRILSPEQQLAEMEAKHARGKLAPLVDDGLPF